MSRTGFATFTKSGAGTLRIEGPQSFNGGLFVAGGEVRLAEAGAARFSAVSLRDGSRLSLDNTAGPADRIPNDTPISLLGGELTLGGHATQTIGETVGVLSVSPNTGSIITIGDSGLAQTALVAQAYEGGTGAVLFRGEKLGQLAGSRMVFWKVPDSVGGIIPGALADTTASGHGSSFAMYDSSTADVTGPLGIRPLPDSAFATGSEIRNPANDGHLATTANFRALSSLGAAGTLNRINSLRLSNGAGLQLTSGQSLVLGAPGLLVDGGTAAAIGGGTLRLDGAGFAHVVGDLSLTSRVVGNMIKAGPGTLTLQQGASLSGVLNVAQGTMDVTSPTALRDAAVQIGQAGSVHIGDTVAAIRHLSGSGTVVIPENRTLTVNTFQSGQVVGKGGLVLTGNNRIIGSLNHSGPTIVSGSTPDAGLELDAGGEIMNTSRLVVSSASLRLQSYAGIDPRSAPRIATVPIELDSGSIQLQSSTPTSQAFGPLTVRGGSSISIHHYSSLQASGAVLSFDDLIRQDRGTIQFSSNRPGSVADVFPFAKAPSGDQVGQGTSPTDRPILPFAMYTWGATDTFVTLDPEVGVRALTANEVSPLLSAGDNVRISSATALSAPTAVNALISSASSPGIILSQSPAGSLLGRRIAFSRYPPPWISVRWRPISS